jgi:hypothetical protein
MLKDLKNEFLKEELVKIIDNTIKNRAISRSNLQFLMLHINELTFKDIAETWEKIQNDNN